MRSKPRVVLFDAAPALSEQLHRRLAQRDLAAERVALDAPDGDPPLRDTDLVVVLLDAEHLAPCQERIAAVLRRLVNDDLSTLVCGASRELRRISGPLVEWLAPDVSVDEIVGKIGTLAHYGPLVKGLERELNNLQRLGEQLNRHFGELDQEMRLAGRLQRDFLPRQMPRLGPYDFQVLYRPASWVSGDMYDVFRIDERHLGMFIADAMGHGVAAGLLTMFLRQALVAKQVAGSSYTIVEPAAALTNLHECLVRQQLPNCQFVTAAYAIIDTESREISLARAGHPYPLHVRLDGTIEEVVSAGSLLGLVDVPCEFEQTRIRLAPGEKLIFYTDGMEDALIMPRRDSDDTVFTPALQEWAHLDAPRLIEAATQHLDHEEGSINPSDDVTLLLVEVLQQGVGHA